nr:MAG TPA: hypothetical protein [Caudoviricetes sp.]
MDRRTKTRQQMRRERREALGYFAAIVGLVILGKCFWDALLQALAMAAI